MAWQTANIQLPASLMAVGDALNDVVNEAEADALVLADRLADMTPTEFTPGALAEAAMAADTARTGFNAIMDGGGTYCCAHPFMAGVRESGTHGSYLSFNNAVKRVAEKLLDASDNNRPVFSGTHAALALAVTAKTMAGFHANLHAFNTVFPIPALVMAEKRAKALLQQEQIRYVIKAAPKSPQFQRMAWSALPAVMGVKRAVGSRIAMAESYNAENISPTDELASMLADKQAFAADQVSAYAALSGGFSGSPCKALYLEAETNNQLKGGLLAATNAPGYDSVLTALVLFIGIPADMVFLRELFDV